MSAGHRCMGHCCRVLLIPFTPAEVGALLQHQAYDLIEDGETVLPMLTPAGLRAGDPDVLHPGETLTAWSAERRYACKHFDRTTNDCTIYSRRPRMCRDFPLGGACHLVGCTYVPEDHGTPMVGLPSHAAHPSP